MKTRIVIVTACLVFVGCQSGSTDNVPDVATANSQGEIDRSAVWNPQRQPLLPLPPGTNFDEEPPAGWSDIILLAKARLASGDVSDVADGVHEYVKMFDTAILANTKRDDAGQYYLEKVGIGTTVRLNGKHTIITTGSQQKLAANLGMIARNVLSGHEEALAQAEQVARDSNEMVLDIPAAMLHQGQHRVMIVRYVVRVSPESGRVDTFVWLMSENSADNHHKLVGDTLEHLPPNMREDRILNVEGDRLTFGIPISDPNAFAAVRIPQGKSHGFTQELRKHAGRVKFDKNSYRKLIFELKHAAM